MFARTAGGQPVIYGGNWGVYALGEYAIARPRTMPGRPLSAFLRIGFADPDVNPLVAYTGAGVIGTGVIPGRVDDRMGIGVAAAFLGPPSKRSLRRDGLQPHAAEVIVEATYRTHITPWLRLQPDMQYVINPGATDDVANALAVTARFEIGL